ncbi:MAG: type II toxin-antitoxin system VapC family toxin [Acidimicrobiales bacterium]
MAIWYLDTSAMAKLVRTEHETAALRRWLRGKRWIVSDLHRTELRRAAARVGALASARADRLLAESDVIRVTAEVFDDAGRLQPPDLRSLDAVHLAAAMALGPDLAGIVAYDERLAAAAVAAGLRVSSPAPRPSSNREP